ncbi:MAG TPA: creatininase family protein [Alphaproteobacteria bacterium]|nr:creatininase family protein [Alphaproteobacteria bacterium]
MTLRRRWQEMTTEEFRGLEAGRVIAILPVAAIEQHGPHLPVEVDARINEGVLARTLDLLPPELPVTVLPPLPVGKSNEHTAFPGTLSLSAETLIRLWTEIGDSVARAGVRKMVIFNSHGGQPQVADIVARDLRVRHGMFVVTAHSYALGKPPGLFPDEELQHGIHGGTVETSIMLHLRRELVKMDKAQNFVPLSVPMAREYEMLTPEGKVGFGWQTQDLNPHGACGNAAAADADRGAQLVDHYARRFVQLLREIDRFPLSSLKTA